jgi:DNA-binding response OmpR family regulator
MATLMLVDDNRMLVDLTMLKLRRAMPGVTIVAAHSAEDARRLAGTLLPDVVVIDRILPDGDGLSLSWELSERFPGVRIILLSSDGAGRDDGAGTPRFGFVGKPYDLNDIVEQVRWALHATGKALTAPTVGEGAGRPAPVFSADATRRQALSRLGALLDGLRAFGAELRGGGPAGAGAHALADKHLDALVAAVQDITQLVQGRDPGN